jgi:hypothetical protein
MILLFFVADVINVTCVSQQVITKTLHDYLLLDYDSNLLPVCATGDNVTLDMDLALRQIMDLVNMKKLYL